MGGWQRPGHGNSGDRTEKLLRGGESMTKQEKIKTMARCREEQIKRIARRYTLTELHTACSRYELVSSLYPPTRGRGFLAARLYDAGRGTTEFIEAVTLPGA